MDIDKDKVGKVFGKTLKEIRSQKGISQENLALEAQIARSFLSEMERGIKRPTLATLMVLSKTLGINASKIVAIFEAKFNSSPKK